MNIKDLLIKEEGSAWIKYLDEFEVEVKFLSRTELQKMLDRSKNFTWDKITHQKIEKLDSDVFYKAFIDRVLVSWRGLTGKTLKKMLSVKLENPEVEIPYSTENAFELIRGAYDFDTFLQNTVLDLENFDKEKIEAEKKI